MAVVASKKCGVSRMESFNPKMIDCQNCDGIAFLKFITYITYNIYGKQLSIYNTPILVCNNCNEQYLSAKVAERIQDFEKSSFIELDFYF